jgi:hypothetical protein
MRAVRNTLAGSFVALVAVFGLGDTAVAATNVNTSTTPGATDPTVTQANVRQTICESGYTRTVRNVSNRTKSRVYAAYHIAQKNKRKYVIDHLVPLELGGSNDRWNLWPQLRGDASTKDAVEAQLHSLVCSGELELAAAQEAIQSNWHTAEEAVAQSVQTRKAALAQFLEAQRKAEQQQNLQRYLASLPPPTTAPPPPAPAPEPTCPNGTYTNSAGNEVCSPYASPSGPPAGATAQCRDGTYSFSQSRSGTCSSHGGVAQWL